jgi:hypothetical protein
MTDEEEFNNKWDVYKVVQKAIENAHTKPAPETLKRLDLIDTTLKSIVEILKELVKTNEK